MEDKTMMINTVADTNCYLYLTLDLHSEAQLPESEARKAFCAGYVCGLIKCLRDNDPIVAMDLGSGEQLEAIISVIDEQAHKFGGISHRDFLEGKGSDPEKNPCLILSNTVHYDFGGRYDAGAEVDDHDPDTVGTFGLQRGFVAGYQTVFYLDGERSDVPVGMDGRIWTPEQVDEVAAAAAQILKSLP